MEVAEYIQLKAFARVDGALLALLWIGCFACYVMGLTNPLYTMAALTMMVITPFYVARRLRRFRDESRGGVISFRRSWAYVVLVFFYGAILLAVAQYLYFAYMDNGYMLGAFTKALESPESKQMMEHYGMQQALAESLDSMKQMRPIDYALNILTMNIMTGIVLGLPIAAVMRNSLPPTPSKGKGS